MSAGDFSAFLIGGTNSGCGKTTLTLGLLRSLARRGLRVMPFKCGPDYIDPLLHRQAAGRVSVNLDGFFGNVESAWRRCTADADAAVVEGVMGLFDGRDATGTDSAGTIAAQLKLPVVLTVNASGLGASIAPLVAGFVRWRRDVRIVGVVANQVGSERHAELLREALDAAELPPLLGALRKDERLQMPERHLGLDTAQLPETMLEALADAVEAFVDVAQLLRLTRGPRPERLPGPVAGRQEGRKLRLAVAQDAAFLFYYEENLEMLRERGVETVFFSPLTDAALPEAVDGVYLGGGYPELFAERLSGNQAMLAALRAFAARHPVYGECGGYLYLLESLTDFDGRCFPMVGLLPGHAKMNRRLTALGYRECRGRWGRVRGHEFHYSSLAAEPEGPALWQAVGRDGTAKPAGGERGHVSGSYVHVHFASNPAALDRWIEEMAACSS